MLFSHVSDIHIFNELQENWHFFRTQNMLLKIVFFTKNTICEHAIIFVDALFLANGFLFRQ